MKQCHKRRYTTMDQPSKINNNDSILSDTDERDKGSDKYFGITPQEILKWLNIHQSIKLPNHEVMFPWLHSYSMSSPPAYPDAISIIRSIPIQPIQQNNIQSQYLKDTGILKNSLDPMDFFITWNDQIRYSSLTNNSSSNNCDRGTIHIQQTVLEEIFDTEINKFSIKLHCLSNPDYRKKLIELCRVHKILPFLKTDPYAWNKYCMQTNVKISDNNHTNPHLHSHNYHHQNVRVSGYHSSTTTKNFQSQNFRRFDLQPSKMIELSSKLVIYCLNHTNVLGPPSHDVSCSFCQDLLNLLKLALNFIEFSYQILDRHTNNAGNNSNNNNNDDDDDDNDNNKQNKKSNNPFVNVNKRHKFFILESQTFQNDFLTELIGTPPLLSDSRDTNNKDSTIIKPLATKYDVITFNNWYTNFHYHERIEMNKMSSATLIDDQNKVWCGNTYDYQILMNKFEQIDLYSKINSSTIKHEPYYSPLNSTVINIPYLQFDPQNPSFNDKYLFNTMYMTPSLNTRLIINCSDQYGLPNIDKLWTNFEQILRDGNKEHGIYNIMQKTSHNYLTVNFPSSGSIGLGNLNINSIETILNICYLIWQMSNLTSHEVLLYCNDGYTETTFLAVAYLIFYWDLSLQDVIYKLHLIKDRPFFLFQVDLQVLGHLETLLRSFSPQRTRNQEYDYGKLSLPLPKLQINHEMFSSIFLVRLPELNKFVKLNGPLPSRILPHMYLGSLVHAQNPELLNRLGITHIVSVGENLSWVSASVLENTAGDVLKGVSSSSSSLSPLTPPSHTDPISNSNISNEPDNVGGNNDQINPNITTNNNNKKKKKNSLTYMIDPLLFQIIEQDGFKICKINNLQDNGKDPLTGCGQLNMVLDFIDECERSGGKVLVHCMVGVSRSATVCIAECMKRLKIDLLRAYLYVRVRRLNIIIQPNLMFMYELLKWQETLIGVPRTIDWHIICKAIAELNRKYM